ncbi:hypothetical protein B9Z55_009219 [Caenorhabditis nigoni]|uniref:Uncharacterized protein n=1 Tax=Caenorhabditis nigoni TaxID=1611254 RepID=A0A2G5URD9_9PELO|nr:hypothetical protein B9Z55_009219 [Caenorhabditis nigoni]
MSRPLLYDLWPTVMERMDLANTLRRTDQRCQAKANTVEITTNSVKINNTSFYVEKYESGEHTEISKDDMDSKTVVMKTTVPLPEAREKLFKTIMKRKGPGAHRKFSGKGMFVYDLIFSIDEEKVLNVFTEVVEKENGMDEYVVHFKVVPKL